MAASQQFKLLVQVEDPLRRNFYLEMEDGRWKMEDGRPLRGSLSLEFKLK
jgi:hypothetical protein